MVHNFPMDDRNQLVHIASVDDRFSIVHIMSYGGLLTLVHTKKVDDVSPLVHIAGLDANKRMAHILSMGDSRIIGSLIVGGWHVILGSQYTIWAILYVVAHQKKVGDIYLTVHTVYMDDISHMAHITQEPTGMVRMPGFLSRLTRGAPPIHSLAYPEPARHPSSTSSRAFYVFLPFYWSFPSRRRVIFMCCSCAM